MNREPIEEETHELSFRGLWMPEAIIRAFLAEKITTTEAMLLAIIDGFSKNGKCWASNAYLAKRMNLDERYLRKMLAHLCQMKLLEKINSKGGQRFLRTICGLNQIPEKSNTTQEECTPAPRSSRPTRTVAPRSSKTGGEVLEDHQDIKTRDKGEISVGLFDGEQKLTQQEQLAVNLKNGLSATKKLTRKVNLKLWAAEFKKFMADSEIDFKEIDATISWYVKNINAEFMPQAFSAATFCGKFLKIQAARDRSRKNDVPDALTKVESNSRMDAVANRLRDRRPHADPKISKSLGTLLAGLEKFFRLAKQIAEDWSKQHGRTLKGVVGILLDRHIYSGASFAEEFADSLLHKRGCKIAEFDPLGESAREFVLSRLAADGASNTHCSELWGTICKTWQSQA